MPARIFNQNVPKTILSDGLQYGDPVHVETFAAVRALPVTPAAITVGGKSAAADGFGGVFAWDAASVLADNNASVLAVAAFATGRYRKLNSGPVDVTLFGVIPDARTVSDAATTAASKLLTSPMAAFTSADVGKTVSVPGAKRTDITGTVSITNGTRQLLGAGTSFFQELYEGCPVRVNSVDYVISRRLTGTVGITNGNTALVGVGTKFLTELWVGAIIQVLGLGAAGKACGVHYKVSSITNDLAVVLTTNGNITDTGFVVDVTPDETHSLLSSTAGATLAGLALTKRDDTLVATIVSVSAGVATMSVAADQATSGASVTIGTDNVAALTSVLAGQRQIIFPEGDYLLGQAWSIVRRSAEITISKGARLFACGTISVDRQCVKVTGGWSGSPFDVSTYAEDATIMWAGPTRGIILWYAKNSWADGSSKHNVCVHANGIGGVVGFQDGNGAFGCNGQVSNNIFSIDCYTGHDITTMQQSRFTGNYHMRTNTEAFSPDIGICVGGNIRYATGAAVTDIHFLGGSVQGFRNTIKAGFEGASANVVTAHFDDFLCENYPAFFTLSGVTAGTFRVGEALTQATSGATGVVFSSTAVSLVATTALLTAFDATHVITGATSGATFTPASVAASGGAIGFWACKGSLIEWTSCHNETEPEFDLSGVNVQVGAPGTVVENFFSDANYMAGFRFGYRVHGFNGAKFGPSLIDASGLNSSATNPAGFLANVGGGGGQLGGSWERHLKASRGAFFSFDLANLDGTENRTGFVDGHPTNPDAGNGRHDEYFTTGFLTCPTWSGTKTIAGPTTLGQVGDTVTAKGTLDLSSGDVGNPARLRGTNCGVALSISDGDYPSVSVSDGVDLLINPKLSATAGNPSHTTGILLFSNAWNGVASIDAAMQIHGVINATGGALNAQYNFNFAGTPAFSIGQSGGISKISFFGGPIAAKPTITGSRGGNAALASLLTLLAGLGLITDGSSA